MAQRETGSKTGRDASRRAHRLARTIDRFCRLPGRYHITLTIPPNRRGPWLVEISRVEPLRQLAVGLPEE